MNLNPCIVARIAYDYIMEEDESVMERAEGILASLAQFTTMEDKHPFVECATFADAIKATGWDDQSHWHFVDNTFLDDGFYKDVANETYNNTWALDEMITNLKYAKPESTYTSGDDELTSSSGYVSYALADSFNLRLLVHYTGDVHQPLHATSRYTAEYPNGDRGGNSYPLQSKDGIDELHALWDSVLYEYSDDISQPLSDDDWDFLGTTAQTLTGKYPLSSFPEIDASYLDWNTESY